MDAFQFHVKVGTVVLSGIVESGAAPPPMLLTAPAEESRDDAPPHVAEGGFDAREQQKAPIPLSLSRFSEIVVALDGVEFGLSFATPVLLLPDAVARRSTDATDGGAGGGWDEGEGGGGGVNAEEETNMGGGKLQANDDDAEFSSNRSLRSQTMGAQAGSGEGEGALGGPLPFRTPQPKAKFARELSRATFSAGNPPTGIGRIAMSSRIDENELLQDDEDDDEFAYSALSPGGKPSAPEARHSTNKTDGSGGGKRHTSTNNSSPPRAGGTSPHTSPLSPSSAARAVKAEEAATAAAAGATHGIHLSTKRITFQIIPLAGNHSKSNTYGDVGDVGNTGNGKNGDDPGGGDPRITLGSNRSQGSQGSQGSDGLMGGTFGGGEDANEAGDVIVVLDNLSLTLRGRPGDRLTLDEMSTWASRAALLRCHVGSLRVAATEWAPWVAYTTALQVSAGLNVKDCYSSRC